MHIQEGFMPYRGFATYYRLVIPKRPVAGRYPLVFLHGGPGSTHNYFELLDDLADLDGRVLVMYDQLGCGESYVEGHEELWTYDTWNRELACLRKHLSLDQCHLLGQSWGGMLAIEYLIDMQPAGVQSLVLSSSLSSCALWSAEQHRRLRHFSPEDQEVVREAEKSGNYDDPAFRDVERRFMERYCAGPISQNSPACLRRPKRTGRASYLAMQGDNELTPTGKFRDWDYTKRLACITQPTLIVSGTDDLCSPLIAKTMADRIPHARWELMAGCRHMCFADDTQRYLELLKNWLDTHDEPAAP